MDRAFPFGQVGTCQLVLVEGPNKRYPEAELVGTTDGNYKVSKKEKQKKKTLFFQAPPYGKEDASVTLPEQGKRDGLCCVRLHSA
jgi:hypothetical protein